jgi:acyl-CoA thioester hydrolase
MSVREQFQYWVPISVRWGDMDAYGHVNNAMYFTYCESARIVYFDRIDMYHLRTAERHAPALVAANLNFREQVMYPAELEVSARATRIGARSFTLDVIIVRKGTADVVADGSSVLAWVDYGTGKSIPLPESLKARIRELDGLELNEE